MRLLIVGIYTVRSIQSSAASETSCTHGERNAGEHPHVPSGAHP
jgi:hypothetical protein